LTFFFQNSIIFPYNTYSSFDQGSSVFLYSPYVAGSCRESADFFLQLYASKDAP